MKKILFLFLCAMITVACKDEDNKEGTNPNDTTAQTPLDIKGHIVGEWVVDYAEDSPEGYSWEIIKFLESGVMYFSNYSEDKDIRHNYVDGKYTVRDSIIATNCQLGFSEVFQTQNSDIIVKSINDYEMNVELVVHDDLSKHKANNHYKKVVGEVIIEHDEVTPDYQKMCKTGKILGYKSHNGYIANVNEKTGAIKGVWAGSTYIDIITDKGTAVLYVSVKTMFDYDYESIIGLPKDSIPKAFKFERIDPNIEDSHIYKDGYYPTIISSEGTWIYIYNSDYCPALQAKSGNWECMEVIFNQTTKNTEAISLVARDDAWFTYYQMSDYLTRNYYLYDKEPEEVWDQDGSLVKVENTWKAYLNTPTFDNTTVGVSWDGKKVISFVAVQKRLYYQIGQEDYSPDYSKILGNEQALGFVSQNPYVVTADKVSGMLTGHDSGSALIKIPTDQESYSVRVKVNAFITEDYESLLGNTQNNMVNFYGVVPFSADGEDWIFRYNSVLFPKERRNVGNWDNMLVRMTDRWSGIVTSLVLTAKDDVWFTAEEMNQYLSERYYAYPKDTNETIKTYINNPDYEKASAEILWDMDNKILSFQLVTHEGTSPIFDFGRYIGKTRDEAKEMMKSEYNVNPSTDNETTLGFRLSGDNITYVSFKYDNSGVINYIQVRLVENIEPTIVNEELSKTYVLFDNSSGIYYYKSSDGKLRVTYMPLDNVIKFEVK